MPTKKKKAKQIQPAELIKLAEEHLNRGQVDEAIQNLRLVEKEVQPRVTMGGKKVSTPPHLVAVQAATPLLLARAFSARSLETADSKQKLEDLEEAIKYAPGEIHYRIGAGGVQNSSGPIRSGLLRFREVRRDATRRRPGDARVHSRPVGHRTAREADDLLKLWPESWRDASWRRLTAIQQLSAGERPVAASDGDQFRLAAGGVSADVYRSANFWLSERVAAVRSAAPSPPMCTAAGAAEPPIARRQTPRPRPMRASSSRRPRRSQAGAAGCGRRVLRRPARRGPRARLGHAARGRRYRGDPRRALALSGARARPGQRKACRLPQWATRRPSFADSVSANRKWIPDHTRASTMSSHICEKLLNVRVTPFGVAAVGSVVPLNVASSRP